MASGGIPACGVAPQTLLSSGKNVVAGGPCQCNLYLAEPATKGRDGAELDMGPYVPGGNGGPALGAQLNEQFRAG